MSALPLEGIRIVDLTMVWAGPFATRILADMGAEVIKIESIKNYDLIRTLVFLRRDTERRWNKSAYFNHYNRNKLGISLDLSNPKGKELLFRLIKISHAVVENYRADVMEKLGLGYEVLKQVKSDIVMLSLPGHGKTGPERLNYAYGTLLEELSGLVSMGGYRDGLVEKTGISYGDPTAGYMAAGLLAAALFYRAKTGKGQFIDLSQRENLTRLMGEAVLDWSMNQRMWPLMGNRHFWMSPHGCYRCKGENKWVTIAVTNDEEWAGFCSAIGDPPWTKEPKFADSATRYQNQDEMDKYIEQWTKVRTPQEVMYIMQAAGVAAGPVMDQLDLLEDPHLNEKGFWEMHTHPDAGTWKMEKPTFVLSETPLRIRRPAPMFGEHNYYILKELLGLSDKEVKELEKEKIIGDAPDIPENLYTTETQVIA